MGLIDIARNLWLQIRNETVIGANTAIRVGDAGSAILDVVDTKVETIMSPAPYVVGQTVGLGKVGYILQPTDPGYDINVQKGLIVNNSYSETLKIWSEAVSDGQLPTETQLLQICTNKDAIGGFHPELYWTSTQDDETHAFCVQFGAGYPISEFKTDEYRTVEVWTFENSLSAPNFDEIVVFADALGKTIKGSGKKLSDLISGGVAKSDYDLAVENGFTGTLAEWLLSLKGANGNTPVKGVDYVDGTNGLNGTSVPVNVSIFKSGVNGLVPVRSFSWFNNLIVSQVILQDYASDISATINGVTYNKTTLIGVHLDSGVKMSGLDITISAGQTDGSATIIF